MKKTFLLILIAAIVADALLSSCAVQRGCGTWKDVQRHDSRPFRS